MVGFIYITTNKLNGKRYIGRKIYDGNHELYLGSSKLLLSDIKRYGASNFTREIIEECNSYDKLQIRELYWQLHYNVKEDPNFYNLTYATQGFDTSGTRFTYSPESLKEIWPDERRDLQRKKWKDPQKNPNNLQCVKENKSERMKLKNPSFREDVKLKLSKPFVLEYNGVEYPFNNIAEAKKVFGSAAVQVRKRGVKKYSPFKGLKFVRWVNANLLT